MPAARKRAERLAGELSACPGETTMIELETGDDVADADQSEVEEIRKAGGTATANYDSVTDHAAAERIIKSCVDNFGRIDILANVAGILRERMIFNMSEEEWDAVINVHLKGTFNCSKFACIQMRQQRSGRIINFPSDAWRGAAGQCNYAAAKGGIVSLTRSIAREMGRYGVTCNAIAPIAGTRMTISPEMEASREASVKAGRMTKEQAEALGKWPGPKGIPPMVVYLASDEAANINGQVFHVETGRISLYSEPVEIKTIYNTHPEGEIITVNELVELVPRTLAQGLVNPAPPQPPKQE